jgi:hypothetical protein
MTESRLKLQMQKYGKIVCLDLLEKCHNPRCLMSLAQIVLTVQSARFKPKEQEKFIIKDSASYTICAHISRRIHQSP